MVQTPPDPTQPPSYVVSGIALLLRAAFLMVAGWLTKEGFATSVQGTALVMWGVGGAAGIAAIVWSFIEKHTKIQQITALLAQLGIRQ